MATGIPLEDNYEATLTQALAADSGALTIYVSQTPVFTFPAGQEVCMTINPKRGFTAQENVLIESYDASAKTLTVKAGGRAADRYNGDSPSALSHAVGSKIIISDAYPVWNSLDDYVSKSGDTMTGALSFDDTDAGIRRDTDDLKFKDPNQAEITLSELASLSGVNDKAKISATDTTEGYLNNKIQVGTGLSQAVGSAGGDETLDITIDADVLDKGQTSISIPAGEAVDGSTMPQLVAVSDGTNGKTSGAFYKADCDDTTNMLVNSIGFVAVDAATPTTSYNVITGGVVDGFSGLTVGSDYYTSATAGAISATPPATGMVRRMGRAISATQLLVVPSPRQIYATYSFSGGGTNETVDTVLTTGFRPLGVIMFFKNMVNVKSIGSHFINGQPSGNADLFNSGIEYGGVQNQLGGATMSSMSGGYDFDVAFSWYASSDTTITIRRVITNAIGTAGTNNVYLQIFG